MSELTEAIDAADRFITAYVTKMTQERVDQLHALGGDVYRLALAAGLADAIPQVVNLQPEVELKPTLPRPHYVSKLNVPGDWLFDPFETGTDRQQHFFPYIPERWTQDMKVLRSLAAGEKPEPTKRKGRPPQTETPRDTLVIAALARHHRYVEGGIVDNHTPAVVQVLAKAHPGLTTAAVSRFFKKQFGDRGHKGYVAACNQRGTGIGKLLARWQGEEVSHVASLDERD